MTAGHGAFKPEAAARHEPSFADRSLSHRAVAAAGLPPRGGSAARCLGRSRRGALQCRRSHARCGRLGPRGLPAGGPGLGAVRFPPFAQPDPGLAAQRRRPLPDDGFPPVQPPFHRNPGSAAPRRPAACAATARRVAGAGGRRARRTGDRPAVDRGGAGGLASPRLRGAALVHPAARSVRRGPLPHGDGDRPALGGKKYWRGD